jgi:hypothetical protein
MTLSSKLRQTFHRTTTAVAPEAISQGNGGGSSDNMPTISWSTQGGPILLQQQVVEQSVDFPSNTLVLGFDDYSEYHSSDEEEDNESSSTAAAIKKNKGSKRSTTQHPLVWLVDSLPV